MIDSQENHRLDPISPRIYSGGSAQLINELHVSSDSDDADGEYVTRSPHPARFYPHNHIVSR
jgi:hypothetical protein